MYTFVKLRNVLGSQLEISIWLLNATFSIIGERLFLCCFVTPGILGTLVLPVKITLFKATLKTSVTEGNFLHCFLPCALQQFPLDQCSWGRTDKNLMVSQPAILFGLTMAQLSKPNIMTKRNSQEETMYKKRGLFTKGRKR